MNHSGLTHAGSQSNEQAVYEIIIKDSLYAVGLCHVGVMAMEPPKTLNTKRESLYNAGLSHVGVFTSNYGAVKLYCCKGKSRGVQRVLYVIKAIPQFTKALKYSATSLFYTGNNIYTLLFTGRSASNKVFRYVSKAAMKTISTKDYTVNSIVNYKGKVRWKTIGILKGLHDILYRNSGVAKAVKGIVFKVSSNAIPVLLRKYCVSSKVLSSNIACFVTKAVQGIGLVSRYSVTSAVRQALHGIYVSTGNTLNTMGEIMLTMKGVVSIVSFITSVPKRAQEFITNKRWFNG